MTWRWEGRLRAALFFILPREVNLSHAANQRLTTYLRAGRVSSQMASHLGYRLGYLLASSPQKIQCRLGPMSRAYLRELAKLGIYGTGEQAVVRRLVEKGIAEAVEKGLIPKKSADDLGLSGDDDPEDKDET